MIKYVKNSNIDKKKWDRCILQSPNGNIAVNSWYLDVIAEDWDALILNDYSAVMPLIFNRKWGVYYLYQPMFVQQAGIFGTVPLSGELILKFLDAIPRKFKLIEISLNYLNVLPSQLKRKTLKTNYIIELLQGLDLIKRNYSKNISRNIKKAEKENLTAHYRFSPQMLIQNFKETRGQKLTINPQYYQRFSHLMHTCIKNEYGEMIVATTATNEEVAGIFFTVYRNKITLLMMASNDYGRKIGAAAFLVHQLISRFSNYNMVLDFEGGSQTGMQQFYSGFGAQEQSYYFYQRKRWF